MIVPKLIMVILRRPNLSDPGEMSPDPLWEFGSFGLTGCHNRNLMNRRNVDILDGARLAFAQGGEDGFKLVLLTPPIETRMHGGCIEAKWSPATMPFKYSQAPILIRNNGDCDFPLLRQVIAPANCPTWERKFASKFRARKMPLDPDIAEEIIRVYQQMTLSGNPELFGSTYIDALPYPPPIVDKDRLRTYNRLLGLLQKDLEA